MKVIQYAKNADLTVRMFEREPDMPGECNAPAFVVHQMHRGRHITDMPAETREEADQLFDLFECQLQPKKPDIVTMTLL